MKGKDPRAVDILAVEALVHQALKGLQSDNVDYNQLLA
jgi:hypothetical protein